MKAKGFLTPEAMAAAPLAELEEAIRPAGFYRQKAYRLKRIAEYFTVTASGAAIAR